MRIAVDCKGVLLSHTSCMWFLQRSSSENIFFIDLIDNNLSKVHRAQKLFNKAGLKVMLEVSKVSKVIHDFQPDSDASLCQHSI